MDEWMNGWTDGKMEFVIFMDAYVRPLNREIHRYTWYCDLTGLPGKERTKGQQQTLIDVNGNKPVNLIVMMAVRVYLRYNVTGVLVVLKHKHLKGCLWTQRTQK